jgi:probable O-glycosylation ligase (exosortase A-associated)
MWAWMGITLICATQVSLFAGHIQDGTDQLIQISKILLMTFVTILLVDSPDRLRQLVLVISLSIGLRALWVSIFGVETSGEYRVYGPHDSFLEDNNDFGLALNMILPLLYFSIPTEPRRWLRICLGMCFFAGIFAVILTYSRGALLGLVVFLTMIAAISRYRMISISFLAVTAVLVLSFAPQAWMDRMNRMAHGEVDSSAKQRLIGWRTGWNLVMDYPITGGGLSAYPDVVVFRHYQPEPMPGGRESEGPHSIYFQVLGENGFVGLGLFLMLLGSCLFAVRALRRSARKRSSHHWVIPYTRMFEVSLAAFMVNGAFLGRAYFDLWYEIVACIVIVKLLYRRELAKRKEPAVCSSSQELEQNLTVASAV